MNIAICDDNAADAKRMRDSLLAHFEQNCFTGDIHIFESGEALLKAAASIAFDAYFLDIYMNGISGVDVARLLRKDDPFCALVFITASPDHMREGYSLNASYVEKSEFSQSVEAAFQHCRDVFMKNARYIQVTFERRTVKIPLVKLLYVELAGRLTLFHTAGGVFKAYMTLDEAERELGGSPFLRCHRSFIVNMNHVMETLEDDFLMRNGARAPLRKNGRAALKSAMLAFKSDRLFRG